MFGPYSERSHRRYALRLLAAWLLAAPASAQVYLTTGQSGSTGALPANWSVAPGTATPSSFMLGGGTFLMSVTTGFDYTFNVRLTNVSGTLLGTVNLTAAQLCAQPSGCAGPFTEHTFALASAVTLTSPKTYYVELVGEDSTSHVADTTDLLTNPSSFSWVDRSGNAVDLTATNAPGAPTGVTASAGNARATISFTAPVSNGGSAIQSYLATAAPLPSGTAVTATCAAPATSCLVAGLTNGLSYNLSLQAQNIVGPGASTAASNNPVMPLAPATSYTLTGPPGGVLNSVSSNFTVAPNGTYAGNVTITPSGGGVSTPLVLTFNGSAAAQTFMVTPAAVGPATLTPSNNGALTDPTGLIYATPPAAPTIGVATAGSGSALVAFIASGATGGSAITGFTATCNPGNISASGVSSPITVSGLSNGTGYTCTVAATNIYGGSAPSSASNTVTPVVTASSFTFTGPAGGALSTASAGFTVTPNAVYTGSITITPSGGGLSAPTVLSFNNSSSSQTFTITPTTAGPVTLTPTNNGSLTNPSALFYATPPSAPVIGTATAGSGNVSVAFAASASTGGSVITGYTAVCNPGNVPATGTISPIVVSPLTATPHTCTVTATNAYGASAVSGTSNSVTPAPGATTYTFTGPGGGALNSVSANFTVTPNAAYTGTITVTPSGGGLSTPVVLTFSNSAAAQVFTITPSSVGPVSLTPTSGGSLTNPVAMTYATPPSAPVIGIANPGNGAASVTFSAPANTGGSAITGYTASCNPGNISASGTASPIAVAGLTNGTPYTCTVAATNAYGASASSAASNPVTPAVPLTYTLTGPSGGAVGAPSAAFTITPSGNYSGTITVTPSGGGLSAPIVLTFSNSATPLTFTITPPAVGPVILTPTNSGSLANPSILTYATTPSVPTVGNATAGDASVSVTFAASSSTGGAPITGYTATCNPGAISGSGASSPIVVGGLTNGVPYTCTVAAANAYGASASTAASNSVTPIAPASGYTFAGPAGGALNLASSSFTVTPNGPYTGTIAITPTGGGLTTPVTLTFNNSASAQGFTITPTTAGPVTLTPTNNKTLTNPAPVIYATPPAAPIIGATTPGDASVAIAFTPPGNTGGSPLTGYSAACAPGNVTATAAASPIAVSGLTNGSAYTCTVAALNAFGSSPASGASNSVTPGSPASGYTLAGPAGGALNAASTNFSVTPNGLYTGAVTVTPSGGGLFTPITLTFAASSAPQTFSITPASVGPVTLSPSNNSGLNDPVAITYGTPPGPPTIGNATAANASASITFTAPLNTGGSAITSYTATCNPGNHHSTGAASPIPVAQLSNGTAYSCTVTAANAYGTSASSAATSPVTPFAPAANYTLTGPTGGALNTASSNFTVTPNGPYTGSITITPSGGGVSTPVVLSFSNTSSPQTFTITPTALGPVTLTPSNNSSLRDPVAVSYATPPGTPNLGAVTPGNASVSVAFTAGATGGSAITSYVATCNPGGAIASGRASPLAVTGLTNGSSYTCNVSAVNIYGISAPSPDSNSVTPVVPAGSYTITGPAGGALNTASSVFTVMPDAAYTGTITITPAGGGITSPIALNFNGSAPQTFTVTPAAVGPVILTPKSNPALVNPAAMTYATPPGAPRIGTATAGNASASIAFTAPTSTGGSSITGYTAACSPGSATGTGTASPIAVTGLTNGAAATCTVTATNAYGNSIPSAASNSITALLPATTYTLTGPTGGTLNTTSSNFTVTPDAVYNGSITITPSGGGLSTPITLTFKSSATAQTFTIKPTAAGPVTLTPTNSASLTDAAPLTYNTPPDAPAIGTATAGNGSLSVAFTAPTNTGGSAITGYTATCSPGSHTASGTASPITVLNLTNGSPYTCTVAATNTIGSGLASKASSAVTPTAPPGSYSFSGPAGGAINAASTNFTVTPSTAYTGTITITPSGAGVTKAIALTFKNSATAQTFTITPTAAGPVTLTPTNGGSLTNPTALTYATPAGAPAVASVTPSDGSATVVITAPTSDGGSAITSYTVACNPGAITMSGRVSPVAVTGLTDGTAYTCTATATNSIGASSPSTASTSFTPMGVPSPPQNVSAVGAPGQAAVSFSLPVSNGGSAITGYRVTSSPGAIVTTGPASPIVVTGLTNGTPYAFAVAAINQGGVGLPAVSNIVTPMGPPSVPLGVSASAGDTQATITFSPPASNGGASITGYTVTSTPGGFTATSPSSPIVVTGLTDGVAYSFTVVAANSAGPGPASASSNTVTPQPGSGSPVTLQLRPFPVGVAGTQYPLQILTAAGGAAPYSFSIGGGGLPPGMTLSTPQFTGIPTTAGDFSFTVTATDARGNAVSAPGSIHIEPASYDLILSQSAVSFTLAAGARDLPAPANITVRSSVIDQLFNYAINISPPAPWLSAAGGGVTPGAIALGLSPQALVLAPGSYQTLLTVSCVAPSACAGKTKTVVVSLAVDSPPPAAAFSSSVLTFSAVRGSGAISQTTAIQNTGSGAISIQSVAVSGSWVSVVGVPNSLYAGSAASVAVTVDPSSLSPGFYSTTLSVSTSAGIAILPIKLTVSTAPAMSINPSGAQFQATVSTPLSNPNSSFQISVPGTSTIRWRAAVLPGAQWLTLGAAQGAASALTPATVSFTVDPSALSSNSAQTYYGDIEVTSDDVLDSPLEFVVILTLAAAGAR